MARSRSSSEIPLILATSDDQQAGLVGGGAVDAGQAAIILGTSAVVNASSDKLPQTDKLDAMRLNWGPYLWMRCYNNGALFLDKIVGADPDWDYLEAEARKSGATQIRKARVAPLPLSALFRELDLCVFPS